MEVILKFQFHSYGIFPPFLEFKHSFTACFLYICHWLICVYHVLICIDYIIDRQNWTIYECMALDTGVCVHTCERPYVHIWVCCRSVRLPKWLISAAHCSIWVTHISMSWYSLHTLHTCTIGSSILEDLILFVIAAEFLTVFSANNCFCPLGWVQLQAGPDQHHLSEGRWLFSPRFESLFQWQ